MATDELNPLEEIETIIPARSTGREDDVPETGVLSTESSYLYETQTPDLIETVLGENAEGYKVYFKLLKENAVDDPYVLENYFRNKLGRDGDGLQELMDSTIDAYIEYEARFKPIRSGNDSTFLLGTQLSRDPYEQALGFELLARKHAIYSSIGLSPLVADDLVRLNPDTNEYEVLEIGNNHEIAANKPLKAWAVSAELSKIRSAVMGSENGAEILNKILWNFKLGSRADEPMEETLNRIRNEVIRLAFSKAEEMGVIFSTSQAEGQMTCITRGDSNTVLTHLKDYWRELQNNLYYQDRDTLIEGLDDTEVWLDFKIAVNLTSPKVVAIELHKFNNQENTKSGGRILGFTIASGEVNPINQVNNALTSPDSILTEFMLVGDSSDLYEGGTKIRNDRKGTIFYEWDVNALIMNDSFYNVDLRRFVLAKDESNDIDKTIILHNNKLQFSIKELRRLLQGNITSFLDPKQKEQLILDLFRQTNLRNLPSRLYLGQNPEFPLPARSTLVEADLSGYSFLVQELTKQGYKGEHLDEIMKLITNKLVQIGGMTDNFAGDAISSIITPNPSTRRDVTAADTTAQLTARLKTNNLIDIENPIVKTLLVQMAIRTEIEEYINKLVAQLDPRSQRFLNAYFETNDKYGKHIGSIERVNKLLKYFQTSVSDEETKHIGLFLTILYGMPQLTNSAVEGDSLTQLEQKPDNGKAFGVRLYAEEIPEGTNIQNITVADRTAALTSTSLIEVVPTPPGFETIAKIAKANEIVIGLSAYDRLPLFMRNFFTLFRDEDNRIVCYKLKFDEALQDGTISNALSIINNPN